MRLGEGVGPDEGKGVGLSEACGAKEFERLARDKGPETRGKR